ncbi:MAG: glycosyltransferase family 4 protein [Bryobacteraceae bacterium]
MKIILASSTNVFVRGGATFFVDWLGHALEARGHQVDTLMLPVSEEPNALLEQMAAFRLIDLSQHGDRLITVRTPAHLLRHPRKVSWFIHHYRGAYDLWGTRYQTLPNSPEGIACREAIIGADNRGLGECARVFSNSGVVRDRLRKFNSVDAEVLFPPLPEPNPFRPGPYGDYLLLFCRLAHHKRQWLAIESLRHTRTPVRLVIAGPADPDAASYVDELRVLIARYGLDDRVSLLSRWIPDEEKTALFAQCLATLYFPFDEDSYGYPSLEAHAARKAVLTTTDSGGTLELIEEDRNGFVTPPDPEQIGEAMDRLFSDRALAQRLGESGPERMRELGIHWDHVVERLLA